jgi:AcrR family transcriptional regulator
MAETTKARLPLTRERILQTALELVDEGGIDALSMRKLGQALGFEAMSLYNHVANKDDVIGGLLDLVLAECDAPSPSEPWDAAIRRSAISVHDALRRHPWACALLLSPAGFRPGRLRYMNALLGTLREAGFSADATYHAYHVLDAHIYGFSVWQTSHSAGAIDRAQFESSIDELIPVAEFPYLHEHGEQHLTEGPLHDVSAFELGLDLILDGLRQQLSA